jgi:hypothetical protein
MKWDFQSGQYQPNPLQSPIANPAFDMQISSFSW